VPNAVNAVIGITLAIQKVGVGSKIAKIGKKMIGSVGTMIVFGSVLRIVMVQHVFLVLIIVVVMVLFLLVFLVILMIFLLVVLLLIFACVMIMLLIKLTIRISVTCLRQTFVSSNEYNIELSSD
jgi:hypothetical protein